MSALDISVGQAYEAHPVADLFPMLADDELAELAADITERGLLQPIMLDAEGRVLDGRNRLAACHLAGVEPRFETYDGDDPNGYALAVNIARRHLSTSQRAMVTARAARFLKETVRAVSERSGLTVRYVSQANVVLDHAPDLADAVVSGATSLDKAYEQARENKRQADSTEVKMLRLRADAPDLAAKVTEGDLELDEAVTVLNERQRKAAENQRDARALLSRIVELAAPKSRSNGFIDTWASQLGDPDDELNDLIRRSEQAAQVLLDLTERIKK